MAQLIEKTITRAFEEAVEKYADKECVVYPEIGKRWTYAQLKARVDEAAIALVKAGIGPYENVAVWATNLPEWLILQFATAKIGAVLVTVNTSYKERDLEYLLRQSDSSALFLMDRFKDYSYVDILNSVVPEIKDSEPGEIHSEKMPHLRTVVTIGEARDFPGIYKLEKLIRMKDVKRLNERVKGIIGDKKEISDQDVAAIQRTLKPEDVVNIQYTSGTTGFPKGAMLTSYNLVNNALGVAERMKFKSTDRLVLPNPLFHCFGSILGTLLAMINGGSVVLPNIFDPTKFETEVLQAIHKERCTVIYGTPSHFDRLLKHPDRSKYDLSSLRTGIIAGAPCPIDLMEKIDKFVPEMTIAYGSTELSPIVTQTRIGDSRELRLGTVGERLNLDGLHIKIVDDNGKNLVNTETGEYSGVNTLEEIQQDNGRLRRGVLWSKGPQVMKGYFNKPQETAEAIVDGWYDTGDIGISVIVPKDGDSFDIYFKITGRVKDLIITGGENIYPSEIESVIREHPDVFDVAVYGIPDEEKGEIAGVSVIPKPDTVLSPDDIRKFCIDKKMRKNYIPRGEFIEIRSAFPMTASGKVQKFKLKEEVAKKYGRQYLLDRKTA